MSQTPKPSSSEEEYFARENAEKLRKLALEQAKQLEQEQKEALKQAHWMRCPKCGMELKEIEFRGLHIDRCFNCGVTVFDAGELEKLDLPGDQSGAITKSILNIFR